MTGRPRRIGPLLATVLVAGNMIGSGIYLLPASMAATGGISLVGWAICAGGALAIAGVFAFLAVVKPGVDGVVTYAASIHPALGFMSWLAYWTSGWVGNVAIGLAAVGYLTVFFPGLAAPLAVLMAGIGLAWALAIANLAGPRITASLSGMTLIIGLIPIIAATALGLLHFDPALFAASWNVTGKPAAQVIPATLTPIMWAFLGLESANVAAAVVDNPSRNLPIAALGGVALAATVYIAANVAALGVLPARELAASTAPFAEVVARLAGWGAGAVVAVCASLKACGTLAGWILVTAESGRAGAASGFLPRWLSEVDPARRPVRDILLIAVLMSLAALASLAPTLGRQFDTLSNIAVVFFLAVYTLCAVALANASFGMVEAVPRWSARIVAALALIFCVAALIGADGAITRPAFIILAACLPVWWLLQLRRRAISPA